MRLPVLLLTALLLPAAAFAQDKIVVKNADGSEQEVELPEQVTDAVAPLPGGKPKPKVHVFKSDEPSLLRPQAPVKPDAEKIMLNAPARPIEPEMEAVTVPRPEMEKPETAKPAPVKPKREPRPEDAPYSPPKPDKSGRVVGAPAPVSVPEGTPVTEKLAKRIALEIAPPARDVKVYPRSFEGKDVYLVRFKTEDGFFDVLVDMLTGDIVATKK